MIPDRFQLMVFFRTNPLRTWKTARPLIEALLGELGDLAPTHFLEEADRQAPLDVASIEKLFADQPPEQVWLSDPRNAGVQLVGYEGDRDPGGRLDLQMPLAMVAGRGETLVRATTAICDLVAPQYGWAHIAADVSLAKEPNVRNAWAPKRVHQAYWLTILGAAMVEDLGPEHVDATPAHRIEKVRDGSVLIVTTDDPATALSHEAREAQARAFAHLTKRDAAVVLPQLLERSSVLMKEQPEVPAPAATVTEWRAVSASDVPDEPAAIRRYIADAEKYVSGFHDEIANLVAADARSLPAIDEHFLERDYWGHDAKLLEDKFVPTLGAHLGRLLVDELGGRWVPRQNRDETQVVIGDRAWLPFLRVKHFIQSREAARAHSLTAFFRAAKDHATTPSRT